MNISSSLISRRGTLVLLAIGAATARADSSALDGRRFEGLFVERGKTRGDAETIVFQGGRFRSLACDRYGYGDAPYQSTLLGDSIRFEAQTESPKFGRLTWQGSVRGNKLDATAVMHRPGKSPVEHWVVAASAS